MKKQIVIFAVGVVLLAVGYVAQNFSVAAGDCQKPSSSKKACANPTNELSACIGADITKDQCDGKSLYTEPAQIPVGTIDSDSGTTSTTRINCIKQYNCKWILVEEQRGVCAGEPDWDALPYQKAEKIIVGDDQCPEGS